MLIFKAEGVSAYVTLPSFISALIAANAVVGAANGTWYGGVQGGVGYVTDNAFLGRSTSTNENVTRTVLVDTKAGANFAYHIYGGYQWRIYQNWDLGWQIGYQQLGQSKDYSEIIDSQQGRSSAEEKLDFSGVNAALHLERHFGSSFSLYSNLGVVYVQQTGDYTSEDPAEQRTTTNVTNLSPLLAFGTRYYMTQNTALSAEYQHIFGDDIEANSSIDNFWLGVNYQLSPIQIAPKSHASRNGTGWYLGATAGLATVATDRIADTAVAQVNSQSHVARQPRVPKAQTNMMGAHAGYLWQTAPNWQFGWQLGTDWLGQSKVDYSSTFAEGDDTTYTRVIQTKVKHHQVYDALIGGNYFINSGLYVGAKLGLALQQYQLEADQTNEGDSAPFAINNFNYTSINPELLLSLGYLTNSGLALNLNYDYIAGYGNDDAPTVGSILFGIDYALFQPQTRKAVIGQHNSSWGIGLTAGMAQYYASELNQVQYAGASPYAEQLNNKLTRPQTMVWGLNGQYKWQTGRRWYTGVQVGYQNMGEVKYTSHSSQGTSPLKLDSQLFNAMLTEQYWLNSFWYAQAKVGMAFAQDTLQIYNPVIASNKKETRNYFDPVWQAGLGVRLTQQLSSDFAFEQVVGNNEVVNPTINSMLLNINYNFSPLQTAMASGKITNLAPYFFSIGGGLGNTENNHFGDNISSVTQGNTTLKTTTDDNLPVYGFGFGRQQVLGQHFAFGGEVNWQQFGKNHYKNSIIVNGGQNVTEQTQTIDTTVQTISLLGDLGYRVNPTLSLLGKFGVAYKMTAITEAADTSVNGQIFSSLPSKTRHYDRLAPEFAAGVGVNLTTNQQINLLYDTVLGQTPSDRHNASRTVAAQNPSLSSLTLNYKIGFLAGFIPSIS